MSENAQAEALRGLADSSYMRCPFCGCKSRATHKADCIIELAAVALEQAVRPEERTILDPEFLAKVNDSRYSSEWVGIALRWRLNSPHPSPHAAEPMVPNGQCSEIQLGGSAVSPQRTSEDKC